MNSIGRVGTAVIGLQLTYINIFYLVNKTVVVGSEEVFKYFQCMVSLSKITSNNIISNKMIINIPSNSVLKHQMPSYCCFSD